MGLFQYFVVDVFTQTRYRGNPAGVLFHDGLLTGEQMQMVAGEIGLETAFLTANGEGESDYRVIYYTGVQRVPLCGHDTIAAVTVLTHLGLISRPGTVKFATDVGMIPVEARRDRTAWMTQMLPRYGNEVRADEAAAVLGLDVGQIAGTPQVVSTGSPFLFVPVRERAVLNSINPQPSHLADFCSGLEALGAYLWSADTIETGSLAHARCFAPGVGLTEDLVTGSASGALGAYLLRHGWAQPNGDGVLAFSTEQGWAMGRPGTAQVCLETRAEEIIRVQVGGDAVLTAEGRLWV